MIGFTVIHKWTCVVCGEQFEQTHLSHPAQSPIDPIIPENWGVMLTSNEVYAVFCPKHEFVVAEPDTPDEVSNDDS